MYTCAYKDIFSHVNKTLFLVFTEIANIQFSEITSKLANVLVYIKL